MKQIYLNAKDRTDFLLHCQAQGILDSEGEVIKSQREPIRYDLVEMPNLHRPTGNMLSDPEQGDYPEMELIPGYCAMALVSDEHADSFLSDIQVTPSAPVVKFSGY